MLENKLVQNTYTFRMNKGWFTCYDLFIRFVLEAINKEKVIRKNKSSVMSWISCGDCLSIAVVPEYAKEYAANSTI